MVQLENKNQNTPIDVMVLINCVLTRQCGSISPNVGTDQQFEQHRRLHDDKRRIKVRTSSPRFRIGDQDFFF